MSYSTALEAAGATVKEYREFGDYQGTWFAFLEDGRIVTGAYGSCSGCDAFQAEFDYGCCEEAQCSEHQYWNPVEGCEGCAHYKAVYQQKLADFGARYLNAAATLDESIAEWERIQANQRYFPTEGSDILNWLRLLKKEVDTQQQTA